MCNVPDSTHNSNSNQFTGAVGRGPARQTPYGMSIDVVRTDGSERLWLDLVPANPEMIKDLRCGACIQVKELEVIREGRRPIWRGKVQMVER